MSTKLVNTFSPSIVGGCLARMGLVLCRALISGSFLEGGDFTGDEAFLLAVPDNLAFVLVEAGSNCCLSVSRHYNRLVNLFG